MFLNFPLSSLQVTVAQLLAEKREYELVDENKKMKKQSYKNSGFLRVLECQVVHTPSYVFEWARGERRRNRRGKEKKGARRSRRLNLFTDLSST